MGRHDLEGPDVALDMDDDEGLDVQRGGHAWRTWAAAGAIATLLVIAAVALTDPADEEAAPTPSTVAPSPTSVDVGTIPTPRVPGGLLFLVGDKLLLRATADASRDELVALVRAPDDPRDAARSLVAVGSHVVALGTGMGDDGRHGAWLVDAAASRASSYLGPADRVAPSVRTDRIWVVDTGQARERALDGTVTLGPFAVDGTVVGATGAGLVVERDGTVFWKAAEVFGEEREIGAGTVLDARLDSILWVAANGVVTITDPNTGDSEGVGLVLKPATVHSGTLSPDTDRVAVLATDGLHLGERGGDSFIRVAGTPCAAAWTSDTVVAVAWQDASLTLVDARGPTDQLRGLPVPPVAMAYVAPESG